MKPILLVEDTADDVFFLQRAFKKASIQNPIHVAPNGQAAVEFLNGFDSSSPFEKLPCLILLDLKLPQLNGLEVLKWVREQPYLTMLPVIILTSSREDRDIREAYQRGANSFKVKPSDSNELAAFAHAVKLYWLEHDEACSTCMRVKPVI